MTLRSDQDGAMYAPVFVFHDRDGNEHRLTATMASNPPAYAVGERVELLYDPAKPANARINSFVGLWLFPTILGGVSFVMLIAALCFLWLLPMTIRRVWPRQPAG